MKTSFKYIIGLAVVAALVALASVYTSNAAISTGVPFGANDSGAVQLWAFPATFIGGASATNAPNPLDISQIQQCTVFFETTNAYATAQTNTLTLYRAVDNSGLTEETTAYKSIPIVCAAGWTHFETNLVYSDIAGQGFLYASLSVMTNATTTNGAGGAGYTYTNAAFSLQAGISQKRLAGSR